MPHDSPHHHVHEGSRHPADARETPRAGHNGAPRRIASWEAPHAPEGATAPPESQDFDLVEASFIDAATDHPDPTSLLRLANVPFTGVLADGRTARLLGYSIENIVEVGVVSPGFGGACATYHPIPAARVRSRRQARFHYWSPLGEVVLTLAAARQLTAG